MLLSLVNCAKFAIFLFYNLLPFVRMLFVQVVIIFNPKIDKQTRHKINKSPHPTLKFQLQIDSSHQSQKIKKDAALLLHQIPVNISEVLNEY